MFAHGVSCERDAIGVIVGVLIVGGIIILIIVLPEIGVPAAIVIGG